MASILVANYDYPPATSVGGTRWLTMKKYLERLGYEVTILTTDAYGTLATDLEQRVLRAPDLVASRRLRRVLGRPALTRPGEAASTDTAPPKVLTDVLVPDIYVVSWVPAAIRETRRIIREQDIDVLVTTSPKDSTHLVGLALRRSPAAWVADFRDGWVFESTRPPLPTQLQRALDAKLEASVVRKADAVVAFSEVLAADFEERLGREAFYVPNGWDPDLARDVADHSADPSLGREGRPPVRLVYTGTLTGAPGAPTDRTPLPLLEAIEALARRDREVAARLELVLAGRRTERDQAMLARFEHLGIIRDLGYVPRSMSLALQDSADVLVLVTGTTPSSIPHKLFEYLGARRPILHLGHEGAADRILIETGAGVTVNPDDPVSIEHELGRIARCEIIAEYSPQAINRYSYPGVAERMAEVIEAAIKARAGR
jgi:glycosyltransferase involved in cell wall biosynthesis